jgi:predicted SAM-dependent methyltransferase
VVKLHLGSGSRYIPGYINVDIRPESKADVISSIENYLAACESGSVDVIYMCHVLEHYKKIESQIILNKCWRVLKKGGVLRLSVPDFKAIAEYYIINVFPMENNSNIDILSGLTFGGHKNDYDYHFQAFDYQKLGNMLNDAGFNQLTLWNWRNIEHGSIDDYSQAYLPHMDKVNGQLMSLNLEAIK